MAGNGVDLEKIIKVLSENPELVGSILSKLAENQEKTDEVSASAAQGDEATKEQDAQSLLNTSEARTVSAKVEESAPTSTYPGFSGHTHNESDKRKRLISALKCYLSPKRQKSLESMLLISEIIDIAKGG